jgi:hypothetical protein
LKPDRTTDAYRTSVEAGRALKPGVFFFFA